MSCEIKHEGDIAVIALSGDIDLESSPKVRTALLDCVGLKPGVLVDMSEVSYIDSSGVASLVEAFQTARKSKHLKEDDFGPGIIDAEKALLQSLPSKRAVAGAVGGGRARRTRAARAKRGDNRPLANLHALFPQLSEAELRRGLEALLSTDSRGLTRRMREVGDEVVFQFASDPRLSRRFGASCRRAVGSGKTRAALRWRAAGSENLRGHLRRTGSGKLKKCLDQGG